MTLYANGSAVTMRALDAADPDLADAIFLDGHPGWSPPDLAAASEHLVDLVRLIGFKRAEASKRDG